MVKDDEIMSAEEFFGGIDNGKKNSSRTCQTRGKKAAEDLFTKMKVKMVMRIYGVSRAQALEIIAGREAAKSAENGKAQEDGQKGGTDEELLSAEDFFA
ncbi:MAG: hypothetical protein IKO55_07945 [Kiritimatiellae bacterium]|nr:hypothetical protein [Kiritimatiellia bacterium]